MSATAYTTAIEKIAIEPHLAHFAQGYRLRASGSTPALTNRRMVKYKSSWMRRSSVSFASPLIHAEAVGGTVKTPEL